MSNLKLPSMKFEDLLAMSVPKSGRIAYMTTIERNYIGQGSCIISHHGNAIAALTPEMVILSNAGWHTRTTANRLHVIATANGVGRVGIRQGTMVLTPNAGLTIKHDSNEFVSDGSPIEMYGPITILKGGN